MWLGKINSSTVGTMRRTAITVSYLQMLCLLVFSFFEELLQLLGHCFLQRVTLFAGVLVFFEELLCMLSYLFLASSKVYFTHGVAWLVGLLGLAH